MSIDVNNNHSRDYLMVYCIITQQLMMFEML